jgi:hypothetical protein
VKDMNEIEKIKFNKDDEYYENIVKNEHKQ